MGLAEQLKAATTRNADNIAALKEKVSEDTKQAKHYAQVLQKSSDTLTKAKKDVLKEKVELAETYIKDVIGKIKVPQTWDEKRVAQLRRVLSSGPEKTVQDRCDKLAALRELQLYLESFPIIERVADLVRKWTGSSEITVTSNGNYEQTLCVKGHAVLDLNKNQREVWRDGMRMMSMSNLYIHPTIKFIDSDYNSGEVANYWELYCRQALLSPKFIVGLDECEKWGGSGQSVVEYGDVIRRYGREDGKVNHYCSSLGSDFSVESLAAAVILNSMWLLSIGECLGASKYMPKAQRERMESEMTGRCGYLFMDDLEGSKSVVKFDLENCEILCKRDTDDDMVFDPDTCEMVHQALTWEHIPVGDICVRDLHDYVASKVKWIKPFGTITFDVEANSDIAKAIKTYGRDIFIYPLKVGTDILDVKHTGKGRYEITVAVKVPHKGLWEECVRYGFRRVYKLYERRHDTYGLFLSFEKGKD